MKDLELEKAFDIAKNDDVFAMFLCFTLAAIGVGFIRRLLEACEEACEEASEGGEDNAK